METALIKRYVQNLHWHLPEETQKEAMEWLIENTPRDQLALILTPLNKACLQNGVKVIEAIGYPANQALFQA